MMKLPWISRSKHLQEVAKFAEAYRWERDEALRKAERAESKMANVLDSLVETSMATDPFSTRRVGILIRLDIDPRYASMPDYTARHMAERITTTLLGFQRDYRPDMRDPNPERHLLRVS